MIDFVQHLIIDFIRIMEGFISYRDKYPAGPVAYFSDVNHWTFVSKNNVFTAQMLVGDWVVVCLVFIDMYVFVE